jgi:hypothetical protein
VRDLDFVSGRFADLPIPKEQKYLLKYFKTPLQRAILRYLFVFHEWSCFVDHTGYFTTKSYLIRQEQKLYELMAAQVAAKSSMNFEELWKIESGKYKFKRDAWRANQPYTYKPRTAEMKRKRKAYDQRKAKERKANRSFRGKDAP